MKILAIPEDFRNDQYILGPILTVLFRSILGSQTVVQICTDPLLGGYEQAVRKDNLEQIMTRYRGMVDLFLLCVDRDGRVGRRDTLRQLEEALSDGQRTLFAVCAWEEIETWLLAGLDLPKAWRWQDIRAEVSVKERYFEPFARQTGLQNAPGRGRRPLAQMAARRVDAIRQKCPEDFDALAQRVHGYFSGNE